jgi:RND family efflux transporter MFP subunit
MSIRLLLGLLAACILSLAAGCAKTEAPSGQPRTSEPLRVKLEQAVSTTESTLVALPATIRSRSEARVGARVLARVLRADFAVGRVVSAGEVLVELDSAELQARVLQARASDSMAQRDLDRETRLLADGVSTVDAVRLLADRRRITEAALAEAEAMAGYARVAAPFDGVVLSRSVNSGDLASPGTPLFTITSLKDLRAEVEVPESLPALRVGDSVEVELTTGRVSALLEEVSPGSDGQSRTRHMKLRLPEASGARPGQFVRVLWPTGDARHITLPNYAISRMGQMERVFVVEDGVARMRIIRTAGADEAGRIRIASGVSEGEWVVSRPEASMRDGTHVEVENNPS